MTWPTSLSSRKAVPPRSYQSHRAAYRSIEVRAPRLPWAPAQAERVMAALHSLTTPVDLNIWVLPEQVVTGITVVEDQQEQVERAVRGSSGWELYPHQTPEL